MHVLKLPSKYPSFVNQKSANFVRNQVNALSENGITVGVIAIINVSVLNISKIKYLGLVREKRNLAHIYYFYYLLIPRFRFLNNIIRLIVGKLLFKNYIKHFGVPDIIHLHVFEQGELAIWIKKKYNIPYIITEHSSLFFTGSAKLWQTSLAKKVYEYSNFNIAVSEKSKIDLQTRFNQEFHYLPNFIDINKFVIKKQKVDSKVRFINVAYLNKNKNHVMLIKAFKAAFNNSNQYHLLIVGEGIERNNLELIIRNCEINNVTLYGYSDEEQLIKLLQKSDYFVLSSCYETFGLVLIEAMSCGLPVISTRSGGPESIIVNNKLGFLCNNEDELINSLIKITKMYFDKKYIRDYVVKNFSYKSLSESLVTIYRNVVKDN